MKVEREGAGGRGGGVNEVNFCLMMSGHFSE